jgi:hypothetical protein
VTARPFNVRSVVMLLLGTSVLVAVFSRETVAQPLVRCAQPLSAGDNPVATDCLFILGAAVGTQTCSPQCVCAPTGSLPVKATDALMCLARATGQAVALNCPCQQPCTPADCNEVFDTCEVETVSVESATIAACPSAAGSERTACLERATKVAAAGEKVCEDFLSACESCCAAGGSDCTLAPEVPKAIGAVAIPEREMLEAPNGLPPGPGGVGFMLLPLPDGAIGFDPTLRTPATAAAECAGAVLACFSAGERNWAGCLTVAPTCPSDTPWAENGPACCADSCLDRYQELRREGRTNPAAAMAAIYEAPSCMPGLDNFTEREANP